MGERCVLHVLSHIFLFLLITVLSQSEKIDFGETSRDLYRDDFPPTFVFGAGTSAYQVEGGAAADGRSPSCWDTFTHAGHVLDKSTGDTSADQYHKYSEDVKLMSDLGLEAYRFSISWSRLLPNGRGTINPKGLKYYNNLIDELISHGIEPHVTFVHLDLPQVLEDEYGGWLSPKIVEDFKWYADVCFREFGDRVAHWTTINEPNIMAVAAYDSGAFPPQRCSPSFTRFFNCTGGNSSVEPYTVFHNALLAHASAAKLYKHKYQAKQKGVVGINIYSFWFTPYTNTTKDLEATQRALDFYIGWTVDPLVFGDYPKSMKKIVGSRMPSFTKDESELVKGAYDFFGFNHYSTIIVEDDSTSPRPSVQEFNTDILAKYRLRKDDIPSSKLLPVNLPDVPWGLRSMLNYMKHAYGNPPIYIQENGVGQPYNECLDDPARIEYIKGYINATLGAIRDGANVKGYFVWSLMDVFEFLTGYMSRYGLIHVDFEVKELTRTPKLSAYWYSKFLRSRRIAISTAAV